MSKHAGALMLLLMLVISVGCGSSNRIDDLSDRSIDDVISEANKLSVNGLEQRAATYRDAIKLEKEKMQQLRKQEEKLDYGDKNGPKAIQIADQMKEVGRVMSRLGERHQEYINRLREKGINITEYMP
jgi:hypothetical protein